MEKRWDMFTRIARLVPFTLNFLFMIYLFHEMLTMLTMVALVLAFIVAMTVAVHHKDYPRYRTTYRALISGHLRLDQTRPDKTIAYFLPPGGAASASPIPVWTDAGVRYYLKDRTVRLLGGGYLLNYPLTYLDPYALYWMLRLRRLLDRMSRGEDPTAIRREMRISQLA